MSKTRTAHAQKGEWVSQSILDLFTIAFKDTLEAYDLEIRIQAVKGHLYDRDYAKAFGSQELLDSYVVRWSPSRALGYASLMQNLEPIQQLFANKDKVNAICIGGGAGAEIVALGSQALLDNKAKVNVKAIDIAQWDQVVDRIVNFVAGNWYNANSLEEALQLMTLDDSDSPFSVKFINHDILTLPQEQLQLENVDFITSMFTTNELFAAQKAGTVKFLQSLSQCKEGTLLLIVESAGSYSEIQVGSKKFPVQYLIHHTLSMNNSWKLLESEDSRWYRVPEHVKYSMKLENMRFFYRLYERQ